MKKLNNKGFTLIELLAIIVILAIIMVVTFPNILDAIATSREQTFANSANSVADWVEDQFAFAGLGQAEVAFNNICPNTNGYCAKYDSDGDDDYDPVVVSSGDAGFTDFLKAAGVKASNYSQFSISFVNGRACIELKSNPADGDFKNITANEKLGITLGDDDVASVSSNGC